MTDPRITLHLTAAEAKALETALYSVDQMFGPTTALALGRVRRKVTTERIAAWGRAAP